MNSSYYAPRGGLPPQNQIVKDRAIFTDSYVFIPRGVMSDIVTSYFPFWHNTRAWVLAKPLSGFSDTFSQYIVEVSAGGYSDNPEQDENAEAVLFILEGELTINLDGKQHILKSGGYAYISPNENWSVKNTGDKPVKFHWIRKKYELVKGINTPKSFITREQDVSPIEMADTNGKWKTTRFVDPLNLDHDMHVNIVTFLPGGIIPFAETHVMEHGLYVLQGKAIYLLNRDWVEVEAGDFMWLRAFCPQACYAAGDSEFKYLLYKNVNRQMKL